MEKSYCKFRILMILPLIFVVLEAHMLNEKRKSKQEVFPYLYQIYEDLKRLFGQDPSKNESVAPVENHYITVPSEFHYSGHIANPNPLEHILPLKMQSGPSTLVADPEQIDESIADELELESLKPEIMLSPLGTEESGSSIPPAKIESTNSVPNGKLATKVVVGGQNVEEPNVEANALVEKVAEKKIPASPVVEGADESSEQTKVLLEKFNEESSQDKSLGEKEELGETADESNSQSNATESKTQLNPSTEALNEENTQDKSLGETADESNSQSNATESNTQHNPNTEALNEESTQDKSLGETADESNSQSNATESNTQHNPNTEALNEESTQDKPLSENEESNSQPNATESKTQLNSSTERDEESNADTNGLLERSEDLEESSTVSNILTGSSSTEQHKANTLPTYVHRTSKSESKHHGKKHTTSESKHSTLPRKKTRGHHSKSKRTVRAVPEAPARPRSPSHKMSTTNALPQETSTSTLIPSSNSNSTTDPIPNNTPALLNQSNEPQPKDIPATQVSSKTEPRVDEPKEQTSTLSAEPVVAETKAVAKEFNEIVPVSSTPDELVVSNPTQVVARKEESTDDNEPDYIFGISPLKPVQIEDDTGSNGQMVHKVRLQKGSVLFSKPAIVTQGSESITNKQFDEGIYEISEGFFVISSNKRHSTPKNNLPALNNDAEELATSVVISEITPNDEQTTTQDQATVSEKEAPSEQTAMKEDEPATVSSEGQNVPLEDDNATVYYDEDDDSESSIGFVRQYMYKPVGKKNRRIDKASYEQYYPKGRDGSSVDDSTSVNSQNTSTSFTSDSGRSSPSACNRMSTLVTHKLVARLNPNTNQIVMCAAAPAQ
ncbi:hypothetical protein NEHOM01_2258 [Nematocida homosporus]|uniref:uncharacterized protein n=1 Tax=Nematocida homosporus TaxID=1912981 RepID=UPI00221FC0EF|nr:uncharacterized protein NEHOM01_2258 [Nematocida homosporus]KAI5187543.1 hypothetical protein NEHOM01_2258 [Nematocida homosporus]